MGLVDQFWYYEAPIWYELVRRWYRNTEELDNNVAHTCLAHGVFCTILPWWSYCILEATLQFLCLVVTVSLLRAHNELSASPRNPNVVTPHSKSSKRPILDVWCFNATMQSKVIQIRILMNLAVMFCVTLRRSIIIYLISPCHTYQGSRSQGHSTPHSTLPHSNGSEDTF